MRSSYTSWTNGIAMKTDRTECLRVLCFPHVGVELMEFNHRAAIPREILDGPDVLLALLPAMRAGLALCEASAYGGAPPLRRARRVDLADAEDPARATAEDRT